MLYRSEVIITRELIEDSPNHEKFIVRGLALNIVSSMSIEDLRQLFHIIKLDPFTTTSKFIIHSSNTSFEAEELRHLYRNDFIKFKAKLDID